LVITWFLPSTTRVLGYHVVVQLLCTPACLFTRDFHVTCIATPRGRLYIRPPTRAIWQEPENFGSGRKECLLGTRTTLPKLDDVWRSPCGHHFHSRHQYSRHRPLPPTAIWPPPLVNSCHRPPQGWRFRPLLLTLALLLLPSLCIQGGSDISRPIESWISLFENVE
jgi:hypothetical protein